MSQSSVIEEAATHLLRHFGKNAKFHEVITDPKHHLDHAHEHLSAAKTHHEQIMASEHPHEVLHHTKQRNHHAKWAESHINHFHGLTGSHAPVHASVEETAAPRGRRGMGRFSKREVEETSPHKKAFNAHPWVKGLRKKGFEDHENGAPSGNEHDSYLYKSDGKTSTDVEHRYSKGKHHVSIWHGDAGGNDEGKHGSATHADLHEAIKGAREAYKKKGGKEHAAVEGADVPFVQAAVEETAAKAPEFGKDWPAHAKHDSWKHHLQHMKKHAAEGLKAEGKGDHEKAKKHFQWANSHEHKAAKLDPFLDEAGKGRIKKPKGDVASVETAAKMPIGHEMLKDFGENEEKHKKISDVEHHKLHRDAHAKLAAYHEKEAKSDKPNADYHNKQVAKHKKWWELHSLSVAYNKELHPQRKTPPRKK
jgi:hypothetical protein